MTYDDYDSTFKALIEEPYAFFLFKRRYKDNTDVDLPGFMDRGGILPILFSHDLFQYSKGQKIDHQHYKPAHLTDFGRKFGKYLDERKIFERFVSIQTSSKEIFEQTFRSQFITQPEFSTEWENDEILKLLKLPFGKDLRHGKLRLRLEGYRPIQGLLDPAYDFKVNVLCERCMKEFEFIQQIIYQEDTFKPITFFHVCDHCQYILRCNSYFTQFEMYSEDEAKEN